MEHERCCLRAHGRAKARLSAEHGSTTASLATAAAALSKEAPASRSFEKFNCGSGAVAVHARRSQTV